MVKTAWIGRAAVATVVAVFLVAGLAKLFPTSAVSSSLLGGPLASRFVGAFELAIVVGICLTRTRPGAILAGSILAAVGVIVSSVRLFGLTATSCGCFGGWLELGPLIHIAVCGATLALLALTPEPTPSVR